jgi:hypothetical protein
MLLFVAGRRHLLAVLLGLLSLSVRPEASYGQVVPARRPPLGLARRPVPSDTLHTNLNEVVVSASRVEESFLQSPVTT